LRTTRPAFLDDDQRGTIVTSRAFVSRRGIGGCCYSGEG
jgi:hypothetical protein